ncbi:MAG: CDP-alcohol phosphatidyltransferase family protein [Marinicaulis sp.]|nr:CDP-alcohol phosphatidyltransferase family protein [Marinicaulis sp.]NNE41877.1 CDP-alcohol phosphatidyltransferase family protein [Marinicaulis sp.]
MTSASMSTASAPDGYARPASIEERSNRYFVHPVSNFVAKIAVRVGVTANQLSVAGLISGWVAAGLYFYQPDRVAVGAAFIAMVFWHVFDGADGRVARATGTCSAFGRVIDGICDHLVFAAVYVSLTLSMIKAGAPLSVWFVVIGAGVSHAIQAAAYEERRQRFQRRSNGHKRSVTNENLLHINGRQSFFAVGYDWIQRLASGAAGQLDEALEKLRKSDASLSVIQSAVNQTALLVRQWSILNANNRTLLIAVAAFFGQPILYFAYELIVLNAVLVALIIHERRVEAVIVSDILPLSGER